MAFNEIYKQYWQKIFRLCMGYVNDHDWAKDIAQDTFVIIWQQLPKFRNESSVGTWIFRIATNNCLRQIEKENKLPKTRLNFDLTEEQTPNIEGKTAFLYKCISELAETDRIIIGLELEDIPQAEIAVIAGISEVNVRVKINRIKNKLMEKIKNYED